MKKRTLNRLNDYFFKRLMGDDKRSDLTLRFLNLILNRTEENEFRKIEFLNPEYNPLTKDGKLAILDIKASVDDKTFVNIELQVSRQNYMPKRSMLYISRQENFIIVLLNAKNNIISIEDIFKGSIDTSIAEPKEIFREALKYPTSAIILAHNHPSGDTTPSIEDIYVTKRIVEAGKILGIRILDHIIIGDNNFFSLKQNGLIEKES